MRPRGITALHFRGRPCVPILSGIRPDTHSLRGLTSSALVVQTTGKCNRSRANDEIHFQCMLGLGHSAMKNARFRTGLVALMTPLTGMVVAQLRAAHGAATRGTREGHAPWASDVRRHDLFQPGKPRAKRGHDGPDRPERVFFLSPGMVGRSGGSDAVLDLCLSRSAPASTRCPDGRPPGELAGRRCGTVPTRIRQRGDVIFARRAGVVGFAAGGHSRPIRSSGAPRGSFDAQPGAMEVSLGTESVQIEIDLKD